MGLVWKSVKEKFKIILIICNCVGMQLCTVSLVMVTVSLNSKLTWNEYNQPNVYEKFAAFYTSNLWTSTDATQLEGNKHGSENFMPILGRKDNWRVEIRLKLYISIGLCSATFFLLIVSTILQNAAQNKKVAILVTQFVALGCSIATVYLPMTACDDYISGLDTDISTIGKQFYKSEYNSYKIRYNLAKRSEIPTGINCGIIFVCLLFLASVECLTKVIEKGCKPCQMSSRTGMTSVDAVARPVEMEVTSTQLEKRQGKRLPNNENQQFHPAPTVAQDKPNERPRFERSGCFVEMPVINDPSTDCSANSSSDTAKHIKRSKLRLVNRKISVQNETILVAEVSSNDFCV